jgi:flagellar biosynthesis chaperone FliJ
MTKRKVSKKEKTWQKYEREGKYYKSLRERDTQRENERES